MSSFSSRKSAEKALVVVITRFCPSVLVTAATTGSLIPLSENALLRAFRVARGEKSVLVLVTVLTSISRFWAVGLDGLEGRALFFFPTVVHSWVLVVLVAPCEAILAKVGGWIPVVVGVLVCRGWLLIGADVLARVLALVSICLVAVSR